MDLYKRFFVDFGVQHNRTYFAGKKLIVNPACLVGRKCRDLLHSVWGFSKENPETAFLLATTVVFISIFAKMIINKINASDLHTRLLTAEPCEIQCLENTAKVVAGNLTSTYLRCYRNCYPTIHGIIGQIYDRLAGLQ